MRADRFPGIGLLTLLLLCLLASNSEAGQSWPRSSKNQEYSWPKAKVEGEEWPLSAEEKEFAASPKAEFPSISYDVPLYKQDTMVWCWVASAKMVSAYYARATPTQCEMLQQVYSSPCCVVAGYCDRPGYVAEIANLIKIYGGTTTQLTAKRDPRALYEALKQGPIVVHTNQGAGHFVVLTGFYVDQTASGLNGYVSINDPFVGKYKTDLSNFWRIWDVALVVR